MKIGFASDHRGYKLKKELINELKKENYEIIDYGTDSELGENVAKKNVDFGVAICGSGIGISIACNKVKGIRCAKVSNKEEAEVTRIDNDSNIVAFGEKTSFDEAIAIVKTFINTESSDLEKHKRRINKIKEYEETH